MLFSAPANAAVVITQDGGGVITEFETRYATFKAAGELVILDGECASACTLVLNIMPRDLVCVTQRARLGFHSAFIRRHPMLPAEFSQPGTDMVYKAYPPAIKKLLEEQGWTGGELKGWQDGRLLWLESDVLKQFYRTCDENDFDPWYMPAAPDIPTPFWNVIWRKLVALVTA